MNIRGVFLSHSSKDKDQVVRLATDLREAGVAVWLDEWEISVGDSISQKIQEGLKNYPYLAIWLTEQSSKSPWVQREWMAKFSEEIETGSVTILPLLAENCDIPKLLLDKKYADFTQDYSTGFRQLLEVFKSAPLSIALTKKPPTESIIILDYFGLDPIVSNFERHAITQDEYLKEKQWDKEFNSKRPDLPYSSDIDQTTDRLYKPGVPFFKLKDRATDSYPVLLMTVYNEAQRKIVLHTIELEVLGIIPYWGAGDTGVLQSLAVYDIEIPSKEGIFHFPMSPQLAIAKADVASFHIRFLPPPLPSHQRHLEGKADAEGFSLSPRTTKRYILNLKIKGSSAALAESGVFHIELRT